MSTKFTQADVDAFNRKQVSAQRLRSAGAFELARMKEGTKTALNMEFKEAMEALKKVAIDAVSKESDLHDQILAECKRRQWIALHGRMDMASGRTVGEPDFIILRDGGRWLAVECKSKTGKLSTPQLALHAWADRLGHKVHVVRSISEFLAIAKT